jgi:hypothetical protein
MTVEEELIKILRDFFINNRNPRCTKYPLNEDLLKLANQHDVGILVSDSMELDKNGRLVNRIIKQKYKQKYLENLKKFEPIKKILEDLCIDYVITKGIYAAQAAYLDESYRRSNDLDVLIKRSDYSKVRGVLLENGYIQGVFRENDNSIQQYTRQQELFYLTFTQQSPPFLKMTGNSLVPVINLDINFHIYWHDEDDKWNIDELIKNFQLFDYKGYVIKTFQDEYMLLHMCLHMYYDMNSVYMIHKEHTYRLKYFVDIYGFIQTKKDSISWKELEAICRKYQVEKYIMYIFYYTAKVFDDNTILTFMNLDIPDVTFLNHLGLDNEEGYEWKESFWERLFCKDKSMLEKYFSPDVKLKIHNELLLEGVKELPY